MDLDVSWMTRNFWLCYICIVNYFIVVAAIDTIIDALVEEHIVRPNEMDQN